MASLPRPVLSTKFNYSVRIRGCFHVYRFLVDDGEKYHFVELGKFIGENFKPHPPPKTKMGLRHTWSVRKVRELELELLRNAGDSAGQDDERVHLIVDVGIPPEMNQDVPDWAVEGLQRCRSVVDTILKEYGLTILSSDIAYSAAVNRGIEVAKLSAPSVRRLIALHFFYGGHPNACIEHYWLKGGRGISRVDACYDDGTRINVGCPTKAERHNPKTIAKKKAFTQFRRDEYARFIAEEGPTSNETLRELNERYLNSRYAYTSKNKLEEGQTPLQMRVHDKNLPSMHSLNKNGGPLLAAVRRQRANANRYEVGERMTSGDSAQTLVDEEHSVWDLDASMPKNYLILDDKYGTPINGLVQPNIFFSVCRRSSAIVGYYVTFGFENGRCYLSLMWSSYMDKSDDLKRWGVSDLEGMVHGVTSTVMMDRGPGRKYEVQEVLTEKMRIKVLFAEPGYGQGKPYVEVRHRLMQHDMRHLPGSVEPVKKDSENRKRKRKLSKGYGITLTAFMQHLLRFISNHNLKVNTNIVLTPGMEKIPQVPKRVFEYIQQERYGHQAMRMPIDLVYRLFCIEHPMSSMDGYVKLEGRVFYSPILKDAADEHYYLHKKQLPIKVLEAPAQPLTLLWHRESDDALIRLEATTDTLAQFRDTFRWEHDAQNTRVAAKNQEHDAKLKAQATKKYNANVDKGLISAKSQSEIVEAEKRASVHPGQPGKRRQVRKTYTEAVNNEDIAQTLKKIQGDAYTDSESESESDYLDEAYNYDDDYSGIDDNQDLGID